MVTDRALLLVLIVQAVMMLAGIGFLLQTRMVITPRSVWWSFMLRDLMWLVLILDQIVGLYQSDSLPAAATILISFAITSLFLFNVIMRYKAHRSKMFLRAELLVLADKLEAMRHEDERRHGIDWKYIPQIPLRHWSKK